MTYEEFFKDKKTLNAVVRSIEIIGEASKKLPESIKKKYSELYARYNGPLKDTLPYLSFSLANQ